MADVLMRVGSDPALDGVDDKSLDALLDKFDPSNPDRPIDMGVPEPPPPADPVVEAAPEPTPEPAPEPEPEIDLAASEKEGERLAAQELQAKIAMLEAHNSRLAGKLGFFEQKLKAIPQATEPYQPETQGEIDRLSILEQRLEQAEAMRVRAEVSQAVNAAVAELDGPWSTELAAEIQAIAPKYADQIAAANDSSDPRLARQIATAVGLMVKAEATKMHWDSGHKVLVERKAATVSARVAEKKATTVSGSGVVAAPPPKQTSFKDMTADEADKWLRENVR